MQKIIITVQGLTYSAEMNASETAGKILASLPIEGRVNLWGDEIYFDIPLQMEAAPDARADVAVGELAYWPTGAAFCIFFGPTPVSTDTTPRAYSPVNVFGCVEGDLASLKTVSEGAVVRVEKG